MMRRREFIAGLGGAAAAWPLAARAQQGGRVRRVGVLSNIAESDLEAQSMVAAFDQTLQDLGWVDGRNLRIDRRWAAGNRDRIEAFAKALVGLEPDAIVAYTTPAVIALRKEMRPPGNRCGGLLPVAARALRAATPPPRRPEA
jgi:putative ABC transport system substrate-binding protein